MGSFDPSCVDTADFLECLEVRNLTQATAQEFRFSCPFPAHSGGDIDPSCYMNADTTAFFCQSCHERGNAIHFAAKVLQVSPLKAISFLKERYAPGYIDPFSRSMVEEVQKLMISDEKPQEVILPEEIAEQYAVDWHRAAKEMPELLPPAFQYIMHERDFDPDTLEQYEFGYDVISDRVTFAVRNVEGQLLGFKGRTWDRNRQPKYLVLGDREGRPERYGYPCYKVSQTVYNAHNVKGGQVIVCEGELNVVALAQHGYPNAVAINGSHFSEHHAKILRQISDSVVIFMDCDQAGEHALWAIADAIRPTHPVYIVEDHEGDPADMDTDEVIRLLESPRHFTQHAVTVLRS